MNIEPSGSDSIQRSRIESRTPLRFDDCIIKGKHIYGIERTLNYANLNVEIFCVVSNLNKIVESHNFFGSLH